MTDSETNEPIEHTTSSDPAPVTTPGPSPWTSALIWLIAGLVAAVVSFITVGMIGEQYEVPFPPEYAALIHDAENEDADAKTQAIETEYAGRNAARRSAILAAALAVVFGLAAGLTHNNVLRGVVGAGLGVVLSLLIVVSLTAPVRSLESAARESLDTADHYGIAVHALQWAAIGIPVALAIGIGAGRASAGGIGLIAMLIAAVLGAVLYVIIGGVISPMENLADSKPKPGQPLILWSVIPPILASLVLSRSRP